MTETYINIPRHKVQEESSFTATVSFRDIDAAVIPVSVRYRIDDKFTEQIIRDWKAVAPAAVITIGITPSDNKVVAITRREERRQITIETDTGLETQTRERGYWTVQSIEEF